VSDIAPEARRGEALNYGSLSIYLGVAIGPFIGEATLAATDYTAVWLVALALAVVTIVITVLWVPETAPIASRNGTSTDTRPRSRLIHPAGILPGVLILAGTWGMAAFLAFVPLYTSELGMASSGPALALYAVTVIVLRTAFATLPDRVGSVPVAMGALLGSAVGMVILAIAQDPLTVYAGTVVFAAGIAFLAPALISVAVSRVDETERGTVVGTTSAFLDLSFGLAPALLGAAADSIGFGGAFAVSALVALAGAALLFARRTTIVRPMAAPPAEVLAR
jgi:MFS family permease